VNLILIGPMGSGKSTIGRALAQRLKREFFDSDAYITQRCGVSIPVIFAHEGEAGFRAREKQALQELCAREGLVLATGGGAVLDPENRALLHRSGLVVYLHASPNVLWHRTRGDKNRPLLQTADPRVEVQRLYTMRDPLYREVAHVVVETGRPSPASVADQIVKVADSASASGDEGDLS
jgi:shikimate kinase